MKYLPLIALLTVIACSRADDTDSTTRGTQPDTIKHSGITILADTAWLGDTIVSF
jgi:hypothetical protein